MKREEKNILSKQRILDAAMEEFSRNGYDMASMNILCVANDLSKGIIYHYFKDKDELYLRCVEKCFDTVTEYMDAAAQSLSGSAEQRLSKYFDARLRFFAENQKFLGVFVSAVFLPPEHLAAEIAALRRKFDELNILVLTALLKNENLRAGLSVETVVNDFGMYMDYFNLHFKSELCANRPAAEILSEHEERCHRQLNILLYGVIGNKNE